jgi:hypothetical protein
MKVLHAHPRESAARFPLPRLSSSFPRYFSRVRVVALPPLVLGSSVDGRLSVDTCTRLG